VGKVGGVRASMVVGEKTLTDHPWKILAGGGGRGGLCEKSGKKGGRATHKNPGPKKCSRPQKENGANYQTKKGVKNKKILAKKKGETES